MKPLLRWAGGKTRLLPELVARLPEDWRDRTYVEPFAGSAALFFHLTPERAVLGDANVDLIEMYRSIRDAPKKTERALRTFNTWQLGGRDETRLSPEMLYRRTRAQFNANQHSFPSCTRAAQFIYLNRTCFNGLYRVNRSGKFNVPYGKLASPTIAMDLKPYAAALKGVLLIDDCFVDTLERRDKTPSFIYADPPYDGKTHQSYTKEGFGPQQQEQLCAALERSSWYAKVMVSQADTPYIRRLYRDWHIHEVSVRRSISADGTRPKAKELIICSY
jgi:DNA adenine methylase